MTLGLSPELRLRRPDRAGHAGPRRGDAGGRRRASQPIFPQQSIREMARTGRSPRQVMDDALAGMRQAGWTGPTGADADHLKTPADVDARPPPASRSSRSTRPTTSTPTPTTTTSRRCATKFAAVADEVGWLDALSRPDGPARHRHDRSSCDEPACLRAAVKYGRAINHALRAGRPHRAGQRARGPRLRDRAERRRDRAADDAGRALHHRRPVPAARDEAGQPGPALHRRLREGRRLQGRRRRPRALAARPRRDRRRCWARTS